MMPANDVVLITADFFWATLIAVLVAGLLGVVLAQNVAYLPHAQPNARSLHARPIPRVAALMLWGGLLSGSLFFVSSAGWDASFRDGACTFWGGLFLGWGAMAMISMLDDWRGMPARTRLLVHLLSAGGLVYCLYALTSSWQTYSQEGSVVLTAPQIWVLSGLAVLAVVWMSNLFNFMDGSDGLAVTMALFGFGAYGVLTYAEGVAWWWLPALLVVAALPLLAVNFPPARMFIGDVGAVPLGFLAAGLGGRGWVDGSWGAWFPLLVFLPFILDASITLLRRLLRGERVWEGHKSHYYQRLLQMGAGHRGTLAVYALLMAGCALTAVVCQLKAPAAGYGALALWVVIHLGLFAAIDYHWRQQKRPS